MPNQFFLKKELIQKIIASAGDAIVSTINKTLGSTTWQGGGGGGGGVSDGDKGDIIVTSGGSTWTIDNNAITNAKVNTGIDAAKISGGTVSNAEFNHLDGVTSAIQTQLNGKAETSHTHSVSDISSLDEFIQDVISTTLVAGTNTSISYNDIANTITISSTGSGSQEVFVQDTEPTPTGPALWIQTGLARGGHTVWFFT